MKLEPEPFIDTRPQHYGQDHCPELSLAGRVRGTWRRFGIQQAYDEGKVHLLSPRVYEETLPPEEIEALEKGEKPNHVSGERLPRLEPDEVEVCRIICWAIKKAPVVALYAQPLAGRGGYSLRLVNEFGREIVDCPDQIPAPLSLGELVALFNQARLGEGMPRGLIWYLAIGCVRRGWPAAHLIRGVCPVSAYYPNLKAFYQASFDRWARQQAITSQPASSFTTNTSEFV